MIRDIIFVINAVKVRIYAIKSMKHAKKESRTPTPTPTDYCPKQHIYVAPSFHTKHISGNV